MLCVLSSPPPSEGSPREPLIEIDGLARRDCISVRGWIPADELADLFSVITGIRSEG